MSHNSYGQKNYISLFLFLIIFAPNESLNIENMEPTKHNFFSFYTLNFSSNYISHDVVCSVILPSQPKSIKNTFIFTYFSYLNRLILAQNCIITFLFNYIPKSMRFSSIFPVKLLALTTKPRIYQIQITNPTAQIIPHDPKKKNTRSKHLNKLILSQK